MIDSAEEKNLNINLLKQEIKLLTDIKLRNYDELYELLEINNQKELKDNIYYLREGMSFYINHFIDDNTEQLKLMYTILQKQELVLSFIHKNIKETEVIELKEVNEKTFAQAIFNKDLKFKKLTMSNLNISDYNLCREVFYKKSMDIEHLDELKNNKNIKNRRIMSFSDYKKNSPNNILEEINLKSSNEEYLEKVKKYALNYQNSTIKRIFNCNEDKMAYFITGAIYPLKDIGLDHKAIVNTYKERGIDYSLINEKINNFETSNNINKIFFYMKHIYKNMSLEQNEVIATELNRYLLKIDWKDKENKGFNFTLLEMYVILPKLMSYASEMKILTNYTHILKNYLSSISEQERKNEFHTAMLDLDLYSFFEKHKDKKSILELMEIANITSQDIRNDRSGNNNAKSNLQKILNIKNFLKNRDVNISCINIIEDKLIINEVDLKELFGIDSQFIKKYCKGFNNVEIISKTSDDRTIYKVYKIPLNNFQFSGDELKRGLLDFVLKNSIGDLNDEISFNSFLQNEKLQEKLNSSNEDIKIRKKI